MMAFQLKYSFVTFFYGILLLQLVLLMVHHARADDNDTHSLEDINKSYLKLLYSSPTWNTLNYHWDRNQHTELKIRQLVLEIHRNDVNAATQIFREFDDFTNYYLIYTIVKQAYAKDATNMPKLVNFLSKLPWCNHQYSGFEFLFNEFKFNNHLRTPESIQFAYQLKKFLDGTPDCLHVNDDIFIIARTKNLKYSFPEGIKLITWDSSKLCIKNDKYQEHLYGAACCMYDERRRRAFTWLPKGEIGAQGEWALESIDGDNLFRIKSEQYQEHLYAATCCTYDDKRRYVFTWIPKGDIGKQGEWTLELVNDNNLFRIRNNYYDEYLYAAECCYYDDKRRNVFTWIPKGDIGRQGEWEIFSC